MFYPTIECNELLTSLKGSMLNFLWCKFLICLYVFDYFIMHQWFFVYDNILSRLNAGKSMFGENSLLSKFSFVFQNLSFYNRKMSCKIYWVDSVRMRFSWRKKYKFRFSSFKIMLVDGRTPLEVLFYHLLLFMPLFQSLCTPGWGIAKNYYWI